MIRRPPRSTLFPTRRSSDLSLSHAERLALAGRIMAEVAHEVGTPLHSVAGHLELLRQDLPPSAMIDRKSTRLNSSHLVISYAVFCLKKNTSSSHNKRNRHAL